MNKFQLKDNEAPKLKDIVTDNVFKKRKRIASSSGNEPPVKKMAAKDSSDSDSSDDGAVKVVQISKKVLKINQEFQKNGVQKPVNVAAKKSATPVQKKAESSSSSDSDAPAKKLTPVKKPAQTPAQKKAASSSDSDSDDEPPKKAPAVTTKVAPKPMAKKQDTSDSDSDSEDSDDGKSKKANPVKVRNSSYEYFKISIIFTGYSSCECSPESCCQESRFFIFRFL